MGRGELTGLPSEPLCAHQGPPFPLAKIKPFPAAQGFKGDFSSLSHSVCYRYTAPRSPKLYKKKSKMGRPAPTFRPQHIPALVRSPQSQFPLCTGAFWLFLRVLKHFPHGGCVLEDPCRAPLSHPPVNPHLERAQPLPQLGANNFFLAFFLIVNF